MGIWRIKVRKKGPQRLLFGARDQVMKVYCRDLFAWVDSLEGASYAMVAEGGTILGNAGLTFGGLTVGRALRVEELARIWEAHLGGDGVPTEP